MVNFNTIHQSQPVTLVGAGEATIEELNIALSVAPACVAVDGGLGRLLAAKVDPLAVIGDMDSVLAEDLARVPKERVHRISEQETTDFDKALRHVSAPAYLAVGFGGGRLDHQLAALHVLAARPEACCILLMGEQIALIAPPRVELPTKAGDLVSLFPLASVTGRSIGLEWPIEGLHFDPVSRIGTSNRALGAVTIEMDQPNMVLILEKSFTRPVLEQLLRPDFARWPPRDR